jgi:hypothetical protein
MADNVFINGRAAVHAGSAGKSVAFPDVCLCPPSPPSGPIPTPLVNTAKAADLAGCAVTVTIEGNRVAHLQSYVAKSTGDEVAAGTGGGVISHTTQGKAYFHTYSRNVMIEGQPAVRHLDLVTNNHLAKMPGNTPPVPWMSTMLASPGPGPAQMEKDAREGKEKIEIHFTDKQGNPVPVRYTLETPAHKRITGHLLFSARLRVHGLAKGSCKLTVDGVGEPPRARHPAKQHPAPSGNIIDVRYKDLSKPQTLATGASHTLRLDIPTLHVRLPKDPERGPDARDRYILEIHQSGGVRRLVRTVQADQVPGDKHIDLVFHLFEPEAKFTLLVRSPGQRPYKLFDQLRFDELFK